MIQILHRIHAFVWSPGMLVFFLATGIRFTIESGFFPLTHGKQWFLATFGSLFLKKETRKTEEPHAVSQFQSFCTALAATLGTGNITGVAAAIMTGGPGAVFWMWVSAFLGMMTNYAENYLGIRYRYKDRNGQWVGGFCGGGWRYGFLFGVSELLLEWERWFRETLWQRGWNLLFIFLLCLPV